MEKESNKKQEEKDKEMKDKNWFIRALEEAAKKDKEQVAKVLPFKKRALLILLLPFAADAMDISRYTTPYQDRGEEKQQDTYQQPEQQQEVVCVKTHLGTIICR